MAGATFAIGLLPTYEQIGIAAPLMLVTCRLLQGLSTGGEYTTAATFIAEYSPDDRRGFLCSLLSVSTRLGFLAAGGLITLLSIWLTPEQFDSWGWRIPFMVALPLGAVGLYLRSQLEETPAFGQILEEGAVVADPLRETFRRGWVPMVMLIWLLVVFQVGNYTILTYLPTYLTAVIKVDKSTALIALDAILCVAMIFTPIAGWLSDKWGRKPIYAFGCVGLAISSYPGILLITNGTLSSILAGSILIVIFS
jgi:MHS family proline/betaine transporter-like MFS transporter